ncbi:MAG: stage II sporulation protein M, partial [Mycobacterium sp.]
MDVDAFVLAHQDSWKRLDELVKRRRKLTGPEVDEL